MENLEIAKTILDQLGGRRFVAMTGAKNLVAGDKSLSFKFGRNSSKSNCMRITLNGSDLYDIQFSHFRLMDHFIDREFSDIYAEDLRNIFENFTGMRTSLRMAA